MIPRDIEYSRDLVLALVSKELKVRYKSTFLGYFWSLLNPMVLAGVYYFVFAFIMRVQIENYLLFLLSGLFPWQAFGNAVGMSSNYFLANASLIKKTRFPRYVLVVAGIINEMFHFFLSYLILNVIVVCQGKPLMWKSIVLVPVLFMIQSVMTFGISLMLATGNLFFRDLDRLTGLFLMLWFYMTPVLYTADMVPPSVYQWIVYGNPMAPVILCWQSLILNKPIPWTALLAAFIWSIVIAGLGYAFYKKMQWRFAEIV